MAGKDEAPIRLSACCAAVLKSCGANEAERVMVRGFRSGRIHLSWRKFEGGGPTPDQFAAFWQSLDPETGGKVEISPRFPWVEDQIVRTVRHPHRPGLVLHRSLVWGAAVLWSEVVVFLTDAQLQLETATEAKVTIKEQVVTAAAQMREAGEPLESYRGLARELAQRIGRPKSAGYIRNNFVEWGVLEEKPSRRR